MEIITQKQGEEVILKNVHFAHNSFALSMASSRELDNLIAYLQKHPQLQIEIEGHTDDVGDESANQLLSEKEQKPFIFI